MNKREKQSSRRTEPAQKRVVILGLPPVDALDVIGPAEVFAMANQLREDHASPYSLELVCSGPDVWMESETGIALRGHRTLEQERAEGKSIDTLVVATGPNAIDDMDGDAIAWIRARSQTVRRMSAICVGAFALAEAGILDGRKATTHWNLARRLAERYPNVAVDPEPIWVKDGNVYTSAGISSGIDLALALVNEDLGHEAALTIAKNLVLFLRRPGGQAQFSVALQAQQTESSSLDALCVWIGEHLHLALTTEILADRMSTSVRTLIRLFQRELLTTPARYVEDVRLEAARRALELGISPVEKVARQCGYHSVDVLRKAFKRRFGVSIKDYAQSFAPR